MHCAVTVFQVTDLIAGFRSMLFARLTSCRNDLHLRSIDLVPSHGERLQLYRIGRCHQARIACHLKQSVVQMASTRSIKGHYTPQLFVRKFRRETFRIRNKVHTASPKHSAGQCAFHSLRLACSGPCMTCVRRRPSRL